MVSIYGDLNDFMQSFFERWSGQSNSPLHPLSASRGVLQTTKQTFILFACFYLRFWEISHQRWDMCVFGTCQSVKKNKQTVGGYKMLQFLESGNLDLTIPHKKTPNTKPTQKSLYFWFLSRQQNQEKRGNYVVLVGGEVVGILS